MARRSRRCPGGLAFHVMNRATARQRIFDDADDYLTFPGEIAVRPPFPAGYVVSTDWFLTQQMQKTALRAAREADAQPRAGAATQRRT